MLRKEFDRVTPESVGVSSAGIARFLDALEGGHTQMHGLMIMRHGKICAEGWWAPFAPGMPHMCNSLTKTYMGTAIGIACTEGLLKLSDRLIDLFPEYMPEEPSPYIDRLTVDTVLCMGTGMTRFPSEEGNWVKNYIAVPLEHEPGTAFFYNSVGSTFLGKIIEKCTGKNVYEYLSEKLFCKIGIDPDVLMYGLAPEGQDMWAWRTVSTTEDNLRLMKLYADGGVWDGERILSEEYVALATTQRNDNARNGVNPQAMDSCVGYGYQMWMCQHPGAYRADGAAGQFAIVIPDKDMIVSINENARNPQKTLDAVWDCLIPAVSDEPLTEDEAALRALRRRMAALAIEAPAYAPYAARKATASGSYQVTDGSFDLYCTTMGSGDKTLRADRFTLRLDAMEGRIDWVAKDRRRCSVTFAMDGSRRYNRYDSPWQFAEQCWANAFWENDNDLCLELLWPEANASRTLSFRFHDTGVQICEQTVSGPPVPGQPLTLVTNAVRK